MKRAGNASPEQPAMSVRAQVAYEIFALRYTTNQAHKARENMLFSAVHHPPMPIE
jgi:hypothetical protein